MQRIHLASDHAGFDLKATLAQHLTGLGYEVIDDGAYSKDSCDYPVFAHKLCEAVERENCPGILICGTGIGMAVGSGLYLLGVLGTALIFLIQIFLHRHFTWLRAPSMELK